MTTTKKLDSIRGIPNVFEPERVAVVNVVVVVVAIVAVVVNVVVVAVAVVRTLRGSGDTFRSRPSRL